MQRTRKSSGALQKQSREKESKEIRSKQRTTSQQNNKFVKINYTHLLRDVLLATEGDVDVSTWRSEQTI